MPSSEISTVAVVPGDGLAHVFKSLGVGEVISGGQTMNPSTQELLDAIEALPVAKVIILPNNGNILLAAQQAAELSNKEVAVVATRTIPQGIAALLAFNYQAGLQTNAGLMRDAAGEVESGQVTTATRSVELDGIQVNTGEIIGLVNERLVAASATIDRVVLQMLEEMDLADREILTLYFGNGIEMEQANLLAAVIREQYPEQEIEVVEGNQPHYHFIMSVE
jgi:dihydroxyacetone kinase-like predicted kinase